MNSDQQKTAAGSVSEEATETDNEESHMKDKRKNKDESEILMSESETENGAKRRNDKKKKKKRKKKKRGDQSESESEADTKARHKKRKKKKKKKKTKDGSASESDYKKSSASEGSNSRIAKRPVRRIGKKLDPEEWTREELMEKVKRFASFEVDRSDGSSTLVVQGFRLMDDELKILKELFRRSTEIQSITLKRCFMTDETLETLYNDGIMVLRFVKRLILTQNALTRRTTELLIAALGNANKPIEVIDLRDNLVNEEDLRMLYRVFNHGLHYLNGIDLIQFKTEKADRCMDCHDMKLTITEVSVVCCVLEAHLGLESLNLSHNSVDSNCLKLLSATLSELTNIHHIDLSNNPLTNGAEDFTGIISIMNMLRMNQYIYTMDVSGEKVPARILENIARSCMVNRSLESVIRGIEID
jgi:hypothetical protein